MTNAAGEYVAQHYRVMVPLAQVKSAENDETIFNLANALLGMLSKGHDKDSAFLQLLAVFEANPSTFKRPDGAAPIADLDTIWSRYAMFLR
jgi:hypothetical protein